MNFLQEQRHSLEQIRRQIAGMFPHVSGLVCEVGCGEGDFLRLLHKKAKKIVGVDAKILPKQPIEASFVIADMQRLPFKDGVFNITFCVNVFTSFGLSFKAIKVAIKEMLRVTARRGRIILHIQSAINPVLRIRTIVRKIIHNWRFPVVLHPLNITNIASRYGGRLRGITPIALSSFYESPIPFYREIRKALSNIFYKFLQKYPSYHAVVVMDIERR